jgi:hypothetical protein
LFRMARRLDMRRRRRIHPTPTPPITRASCMYTRQGNRKPGL